MRIHILEDALLYAEMGFAVFPLQPRRKEKKKKNGFKDATTDPNQIRLWWGEGKEYNIGIATGSGGRHLLYHSKNTESCRNRLYPGIDVRADGGYIVAPPSIHPNGQMYEWETDVSSGIT